MSQKGLAMQREGSYGNSHSDTDVEAQGNLFAADPDWIIDHDPSLAQLTEEQYERFERAVDIELAERSKVEG